MHVSIWVTVYLRATYITNNYYYYHHCTLHCIQFTETTTLLSVCSMRLQFLLSDYLLVQLGTLKLFSLNLKGFYHLKYFLSGS